MAKNQVTRRRTVIKSLGVLGIAGLAGCNSQSSDETNTGTSPDSPETATSTESGTPKPSEESTANQGRLKGWPMLNHDPRNSGRTTGSGPGSPVGVKWSLEFSPESEEASPVVVDGAVYACGMLSDSENSKIFAFSAADGTKKWSKTEYGLSYSPAVVNGILYTGSANGRVLALNAEDGSEKWVHETEAGEGFRSSPAVVGGTVYLGDNGGKVYALSAEDGSEKWSHTTGGSITTSPAIADGTVFVGSGNGKVYGLEAASGSEIWTYETGKAIDSSPTVVDGTVYIGSDDAYVYALDAESGEEKWSYETPGMVKSSPAVSNGTVVVGSYPGYVYALDTETGENKWEYAIEEGAYSSPAVAGNTVYIGSVTGTIHAINTKDGVSKKWAHETGDSELLSSPVVAESSVFILGPKLLALSQSGDTAENQGSSQQECGEPDLSPGSSKVGETVVFTGKVEWKGEDAMEIDVWNVQMRNPSSQKFQQLNEGDCVTVEGVWAQNQQSGDFFIKDAVIKN